LDITRLYKVIASEVKTHKLEKFGGSRQTKFALRW